MNYMPNVKTAEHKAFHKIQKIPLIPMAPLAVINL